MVPNLHFAAYGAACGTNTNEVPHRHVCIGEIDHSSPLECQNPSFCGFRRQVTNGGNTTAQPQIANCATGSSHRLLNLPDLTGDIQHHHDLDTALCKGGAHPCLHKFDEGWTTKLEQQKSLFFASPKFGKLSVTS